jgi:RNase H-fold protein (predicted Holliday junction resolvase)
VILAIDPGQEKCGLALLEQTGSCIWHRIVSRVELPSEIERILRDETIDRAVVGSGTTSRSLVSWLAEVFGADRVSVIDEKNSTFEARTLYFDLNPPRGFARFLPRGLLSPPGPIDDYAAIILGRRYLKSVEGGR